MYMDIALIKVSHVPGRSEQLDVRTVSISCNGRATGHVMVPKEYQEYVLIPSSRSRWARSGLHVGPNGSIRANPQGILSVSLFNWSPDYALIIREGDFIALVCEQWLENLPWVKTVPLTAGTDFLRMKTAVLPTRNSMPYFDPREMDMRVCMEVVAYQELELKAYDLLVVQAENHDAVPDQCVGVITSAVRQWLHNSARYAHGGSAGRLALEYKVFELTLLKPGKHIADLAIYDTLSSLPRYTGELGRQDTLIPTVWQ